MDPANAELVGLLIAAASQFLEVASGRSVRGNLTRLAGAALRGLDSVEGVKELNPARLEKASALVAERRIMAIVGRLQAAAVTLCGAKPDAAVLLAARRDLDLWLFAQRDQAALAAAVTGRR